MKQTKPNHQNRAATHRNDYIVIGMPEESPVISDPTQGLLSNARTYTWRSKLFSRLSLAIMLMLSVGLIILAYPDHAGFANLHSKKSDLLTAMSSSPATGLDKLRIRAEQALLNEDLTESREILSDMANYPGQTPLRANLHILVAAEDLQQSHRRSESEQKEYNAEIMQSLTAMAQDSTFTMDAALLEKAADLSEQLNTPLLAAHFYQQLALSDTNRADHWWGKTGQNNLNAGKTDLARQNFTDAIKQSSDHQSAAKYRLMLLDILVKTDEIPQARRLVKTLTSSTSLPTSVQNLEQLSRITRKLGLTDASYIVYSKLIENDSLRRNFWVSQAAQLLLKQEKSKNNTASSTAHALALSKNTPTSLIIEKRRARLMIKDGDYKQALRTLEERISVNPRRIDLIRQAIALTEIIDDIEGSRIWLEWLLKLKPNDSQSILQLITLEVEHDNLEAALEIAREWALRANDSHIARHQLALLEEWNGNYISAYRHWLWLEQQKSPYDAQVQLQRIRVKYREYDGTDIEKLIQGNA